MSNFILLRPVAVLRLNVDFQRMKRQRDNKKHRKDKANLALDKRERKQR